MITEEQRQKVLKALRDSYANLTAEHTTEKEFENIIEAMEIVKKLTLTDVSQQRELLLAYEDYLNEYHTKEDRIKQVEKYLKANNCG